jgi:hypothetical protein
MKRRSFILMDNEPGAGGGGAPVVPPVTPPVVVPPVVPPVADPGASVLAKPVPLAERIPEKFHVKNGEELDADASWGKLAESYKALEARVGTGDVPPKTAEEYTVTVPEAFKEHWKEDERFTAFRAEALAAGITQKQMDLVMDRYFKTAPELINGAVNNSTEAVMASLDKAWGANYDKELQAAAKTFETYADPADKGKFDDIMRDPSLAYRLLAKIGPELGEARGIPAGTEGTSAESIQALLTSPILRDPKHPEYAATRAKVDNYYIAKHGTAAVT